jgi:hypothetical protein
MLSVSWDDIANSPNGRVNAKEESISPKIITAMFAELSYVAIQDVKASEKRHRISQTKANVGKNMQKCFFSPRLSSRFNH